MNLFSDRAAAAEFARQLDERRPAGAQTPLLAVAARLAEAAPAPALRPEFRDALRTRLVAVATVQAARTESAPAPRSLTLRAPAWRSALAVGGMASVIGVTGVAGVAVAGTQSLPGDPFYGVKRTAEAASFRLTDGPLERGERHLELASHRLDEVAGLTRGHGASSVGALGNGPAAAAAPALSASTALLVRRTLDDMDASTRAGGRELMTAAQSTGSAAPLRMLARFTAQQAEELAALMPALPDGAQLRAQLSMAVVAAVHERVEEVVASVEAATPGEDAPPSSAVPGGTSGPTGTASPGPATSEPDAPSPSPGGSEPAPAPVAPVVPAPGPRSGTPLPDVVLPTRTPDPVVPVPTPFPSPVPTLDVPELPTAPALPAAPAMSLPTVELPAVDLTSVQPPAVVLPTAPAVPTLPVPTLPVPRLR